MAPRRLSPLGRVFAHLKAQKRSLHPDVPLKGKTNNETIRLGSTVEKRLNEQNTRIAHLKAKKEILEQKLDTKVEKQKMTDEIRGSRVRVHGNSLLFKYMKHSLFVVAVGTGILAGKVYELYT